MFTALVSLVFVLALCVLAGGYYALVFPLIGGASGARSTPGDDDRAQRLERHITAVASEPHNVDHYPALERAALYIEHELASYGLATVLQRYTVDGRSVRNIEVVFEPPGAGPTTPTFVVGAHYDSPDDSPGANDNGTGVAAALELARKFSGKGTTAALKPRTHRLRLVFWVNEELPYGKTPDMGSWRHAERLKKSGEQVVGMVALETLGYFSETPGSQQFPFPFGLIYPDRGNFVAFVGLPGSRGFTHRLTRGFRRHCAISSIGGVVPGFIPGVDLSDHWAYHQFGFPALMVTDTAPFRNPHYHQPDDLPETVDYVSLARITAGLEKAIHEMVQ